MVVSTSGGIPMNVPPAAAALALVVLVFVLLARAAFRS
jgi:hypothetical protein